MPVPYSLILTASQITYDLDDCIRPDEEERLSVLAQSENPEHSFDLQMLELEYPKDLKWLLELAENKKDHFPGLKRVVLMERCGLLRSGIHPMNWKLPATIKAAFNHVDIAFRAVMRVTTPAPNFD